MEDKYLDFDKKRMNIFSELVKRYWEGSLKSVDDLKALAEDIKDKYGFDDSDLPFIRNHIRLAMGQDPRGDEPFVNEIEFLNSSFMISQPVVSKLEGPCDKCTKEECECREPGKYETDIYQRLSETIRDGYSNTMEVFMRKLIMEVCWFLEAGNSAYP